MAIYTYEGRYLEDFEAVNSLEWVMTSGNGAYAGGTLAGGRSRTHQGYLVASLEPPTRRYAVLEEVTEFVRLGGTDYDLQTALYSDGARIEGYRYLKKVTYDGTVKFSYELRPTADKQENALTGGHDGREDNGTKRHALPECESGTCAMSITRHMALLRGKNTLVIDYHLVNYSADQAEIYLTPKFSIREHDRLIKKDELSLECLLTGDTLSLVRTGKTPGKGSDPDIRVDFGISEGEYLELKDKYEEGRVLPVEVALETEGICDLFMPYDIRIEVAPGEAKHVSVMCDVVTGGGDHLEAATDMFVVANTARRLIKQVQEYYAGIEENACERMNRSDEFFKRLVLDADHFIADRRSTGQKTVLAGLPWFTDWGRDTMIAFTGLTLCTGRYEDAREILKSFAVYEKNGLIPNMFPDDGGKPLYNTADASLWYFIAVWNYIRYIEKTDSFIKNEVYPVLIKILDAYEHGTDNDIHMEPSGLIHAGSGTDQVTWMDVRVDGVCVTPRHGCPVEINALWYNALKIGAKVASDFGDEKNSVHFSKIADQIGTVFEQIYYNNETGCLYDVVDGCIADPEGVAGYLYTKCDASVRPNQLYAVALPFSPVSESTARQIVDIVEERLYTGCGIRSLDPGHPDYHGLYRGSLEKRDQSYHQGTAWGFLLGAYISAYRKVHAEDPGVEDEIDGMFECIRIHQEKENCIGGICEVFEGDPPHKGCGCYTQAWSTGEILRAYTERKQGR